MCIYLKVIGHFGVMGSLKEYQKVNMVLQ